MSNPYSLSTSKYSTHVLLGGLIGQDKNVLDIGCNDGYLKSVSHDSNSFYGLDYLSDSVEKAKKVYQDAVVYDLNDLKRLPWDMTYDCAIFADVLEHVLYPQRVIEFFSKNYLHKESRVLVSLPNIGNWQCRLNLLFGKFDYTDSGIMDKTHLHMYTFKSAAQLAEQSGLVVKRVYSGSTIFGPISNRVALLRGLLSTNIILECGIK